MAEKLTVTGWSMIGTTRRNGHVVAPAGIRLDLSDGRSRWVSEGVGLDAALDQVARETGADTVEIRARIARWVATGNPDG